MVTHSLGPEELISKDICGGVKFLVSLCFRNDGGNNRTITW